MANMPPELYVFSVEGFYRLDVSFTPIQEPYVFSHGLTPIAEPISFSNPEKKPHVRYRVKKRSRPPPPSFQPARAAIAPLFTFDRHTVLPPGLYSPSIYAIFYAHPYSSVQRKSLLQHYRNGAWNHRCALVGSPLAGLFCDSRTIFESIVEELAAAETEEGRLRRVMCRFFHGIRIRRLTRHPLNAEDPATLAPPRIPIVLYDWDARGVWYYEAASVRDQISAQLSHVSYGFPSSQSPRNPLTNKEYTYGQLLSIVRQLRAAGKTNSLVEGYAEVGCKNGVFQALHWRKIRLRNFERVYSDERSEEFREDCAGFIVDLIYTLVQLEFRLEFEDLFNWAVKYAIATPYIQEWKGLYRQFQITEILYKDDPVYDRMRRSIRGLAAILFKRKKDIDGLKALWNDRVLAAIDGALETESYETDESDGDESGSYAEDL